MQIWIWIQGFENGCWSGSGDLDLDPDPRPYIERYKTKTKCYVQVPCFFPYILTRMKNIEDFLQKVFSFKKVKSLFLYSDL